MFSSCPDRFSKQLERLNNNDPNLKELFLSWHGSVDMKSIAAGLGHHPSVKTVHLRGNRIDPNDVAILLDALKNNKLVESLHLGENHIGDEGARLIGEFLQNNKTLKALFLMGNSFTDEGAIHLAASLCTNNTLEILYLSKNEIGNKGAAALANMLISNRGLKKLHLHLTKMNDEARARLLDVLQHHNYVLEELDFGGNNRVARAQVNYYRRLNKAGRHLLLQDNGAFPDSLWANVLAKISKEPHLLYYFIQAKPDLIKDGGEER